MYTGTCVAFIFNMGKYNFDMVPSNKSSEFDSLDTTKLNSDSLIGTCTVFISS